MKTLIIIIYQVPSLSVLAMFLNLSSDSYRALCTSNQLFCMNICHHSSYIYTWQALLAIGNVLHTGTQTLHSSSIRPQPSGGRICCSLLHRIVVWYATHLVCCNSASVLRGSFRATHREETGEFCPWPHPEGVPSRAPWITV